MSSFNVNTIYELIGFGADPKPRLDQDGNPRKFAPAGDRPTYTTGCGVVGKNGMDKSVTVATLEPCKLEAGKKYKTAGQTWVTPWISGNYLRYSVVAERVEPTDDDPMPQRTK